VKYTLALLTHGDSPHLAETLESFLEQVTPAPTRLCTVRDGHGRLPPILDGRAWNGKVLIPQMGFCRATRSLWHFAMRDLKHEREPSWVFWLEHDFRFLRPVDLGQLADVLDRDMTVAQVALMRGPENSAERRAGGVIAAKQREGYVFIPQSGWLRHYAYFTTNPALMSVHFMRANRFPLEEKECEGKFGLALKDRGYSFAVWGDGTPWVEHLGTRDGFGY
jgi:hypothetical protein